MSMHSCAVHVTICSTRGKFQPVSELHALTLDACSFTFLSNVIALASTSTLVSTTTLTCYNMKVVCNWVLCGYSYLASLSVTARKTVNSWAVLTYPRTAHTSGSVVVQAGGWHCPRLCPNMRRGRNASLLAFQPLQQSFTLVQLPPLLPKIHQKLLKEGTVCPLEREKSRDW